MVLQYVTQFYRGDAPTVSGTLFTNTPGNTAVVTTVLVSNTDSVDHTYTIVVDGAAIAGGVTIPGNSVQSFDDLRAVLTGSDQITGFASSVNVKFHLSGVVN